MKKFASINKRSSQLFLTKRAQTFLKIASIYDEFGDYRMAEAIQAEAIKYSKYIKVAQDLSDDDAAELNDTADVNEDIENIPLEKTRDFIDNLAHPELRHPVLNSIPAESKFGDDHGYLSGSDLGLHHGAVAYLEKINGFNDVVKLLLTWLSAGGNNIYKSLVSVSDNYRNLRSSLEDKDSTTLDDKNRYIKIILNDSVSFSKTIGAALAAYYKNPSFLFANYSQLIKNIAEGTIDAESVATIKIKIKIGNEDIDFSIQRKNEVIEALPELPSDPELANKIVFYLYKKLIKRETTIEDITKTDIKNLSLAVLYGNNEYEQIKAKYEILNYLPENVAMSVLDKPVSHLDRSMSATINKIIGFETEVDYKSPVFKFLYDYLSQHPQVGKKFRDEGYPVKVKYNDLLYILKFISPDQVDAYLNNEFPSQRADRFVSLGNFLYVEGQLPDYDSVCTEIVNLTGSRDVWKNLNYYILYKTNKDKALTVFENFKGRYYRTSAVTEVNLVIVDPETYLDYLINNINSENLITKTDELNVAFTKLGNELFKYPPVLVDEICNNISKVYTYDDPKVFELPSKILANNPDFLSYTEDEQKSALRFFRSNENYIEIPYNKILNFKKFSGVSDSETAANHLLMFGELTPQWVKRTPRNTGFSTPPELLKQIGKQILDNGFFLGSIDTVFTLFANDYVSDYNKNRPIQELIIAKSTSKISYQSELSEKLELIDQVKESIKKAAEINPEYKALVPGSRDYYYIVSYLCHNYSVRGQSVQSFLKLRDMRMKARITDQFSINYGQNTADVIKTVISETGLEPTSTNYKRVFNIYELAKRASNYAYNNISDNIIIAALVDIVNKYKNEYDIYYDKANSGEIVDLLRQYALDPNVPEFQIVNNLDFIITEEDRNFYDGHYDALDPYYNNIANTVSIFGRLLPIVLDKFAQTYLRMPNVKSIDDIPLNRFRETCDKFFENLPTKKQDYRGFGQFFIQRFKKVSDLGEIRKIGEDWTSTLKIFDENNRIVGNEVLRDIALKHSMEELSYMLQMTFFSEIYEDYENANKDFVKVFCKYDSDFEDAKSYEYNRVKRKYPIREKIYLDSLNVPLPSWANYRKTVQKPNSKSKITLKFLPRSDARGLYLGVIAGCCQHLDGQAACCAIDGQLSPKAAFMIIELDDQWIAQCYTWEDNNGNICIDSFETIGDEAYHSDTNRQVIKDLLIDFAKSSINNNIITIGTNRFEFDRSPLKLINPTQSFTDYTDTLSYTSLYRDDHSNQSVIIDSRVDPISYEEYRENNPIHYGGDLCPICGEMALNEDIICENCNYDADYYSKCPKCEMSTLKDGVCQNRQCDFEYSKCPSCESQEYNSEDEVCNNCGFSFEGCDDCPKCGESTLKDGRCRHSDCNYDVDDYDECPRCDEFTVENGECIVCGYRTDEVEIEEEEEEDE